MCHVLDQGNVEYIKWDMNRSQEYIYSLDKDMGKVTYDLGQYYRLSDPFTDAYAAWEFVSENKEQVLLNVVMMEVHGSKEIHYVKLKGLEPKGRYIDEKTGIVYYGSTLMKAGIPLPEMKGDAPAYQLELHLDVMKKTNMCEKGGTL